MKIGLLATNFKIQIIKVHKFFLFCFICFVCFYYYFFDKYNSTSGYIPKVTIVRDYKIRENMREERLKGTLQCFVLRQMPHCRIPHQALSDWGNSFFYEIFIFTSKKVCVKYRFLILIQTCSKLNNQYIKKFCSIK